MKPLRYALEAALLALLLAMFRVLPVRVASALGGKLGQWLGPWTNQHLVAHQNLTSVMPELGAAARLKLMQDLWDHLGRTIGEMAFLPGKTLTSRVTYHGLENLPKGGKPVIFFSAHLGQWELLGASIFDHGVPVALAYRHLNNPYADRILAWLRGRHCTSLFPKGPHGAVALARALKQGVSLGMLVDQKMNEGIAVPFFGKPAMTAPAIAQFALKYELPLIPVRTVRMPGCRFETTFYPPLTYDITGDKDADALAIMTQINALLEEWIRARPEQWFWVHKRWPKF